MARGEETSARATRAPATASPRSSRTRPATAPARRIGRDDRAAPTRVAAAAPLRGKESALGCVNHVAARRQAADAEPAARIGARRKVDGDDQRLDGARRLVRDRHARTGDGLPGPLVDDGPRHRRPELEAEVRARLLAAPDSRVGAGGEIAVSGSDSDRDLPLADGSESVAAFGVGLGGRAGADHDLVDGGLAGRQANGAGDRAAAAEHDLAHSRARRDHARPRDVAVRPDDDPVVAGGGVRQLDPAVAARPALRERRPVVGRRGAADLNASARHGAAALVGDPQGEAARLREDQVEILTGLELERIV
jgi:hypothetical protein